MAEKNFCSKTYNEGEPKTSKGHYNGTPPSNYCPSVARFRFISENYLCEKCDNRFENETEVMIHIRNVHYKDVRKMFASDAIEHLEADQEYHMGQFLQDGKFGYFASYFFKK